MLNHVTFDVTGKEVLIQLFSKKKENDRRCAICSNCSAYMQGATAVECDIYGTR